MTVAAGVRLLKLDREGNELSALRLQQLLSRHGALDDETAFYLMMIRLLDRSTRHAERKLVVLGHHFTS